MNPVIREAEHVQQDRWILVGREGPAPLVDVAHVLVGARRYGGVALEFVGSLRDRGCGLLGEGGRVGWLR